MALADRPMALLRCNCSRRSIHSKKHRILDLPSTDSELREPKYRCLTCNLTYGKDMPDLIPIQDMTAVQVEAMLQAKASELSTLQALLLEIFIEQIGGEQNAWDAVRMLKTLEEAN